MSQFIGNAQPQFILTQADKSHLSYAYSMDVEMRPVSTIGYSDFTSSHWPRSSLAGDMAVDVGLWCDGFSYRWGYPDSTQGTNSRIGISGVTRDQYGSPIGSVTVKLFRTSDNSLQDVKASDPTTGSYLLSTPYYPDAHYIIAYKAGSPDIAGATVNTLIGS